MIHQLIIIGCFRTLRHLELQSVPIYNLPGVEKLSALTGLTSLVLGLENFNVEQETQAFSLECFSNLRALQYLTVQSEEALDYTSAIANRCWKARNMQVAPFPTPSWLSLKQLLKLSAIAAALSGALDSRRSAALTISTAIKLMHLSQTRLRLFLRQSRCLLLTPDCFV